MKKIFIVLVAVSLGVCSIAGCTQSDNNTSSTPYEQVSNEPSEESQNSEQISDASSEQSQNSEQTSDMSSEQSQNSEQTSDESKNPDESTSYSKITLSKAKDIIAEHNDFDDIWNEFNKTFGLPDQEGGYNIITSKYWLDEDGKEKIIIYHTFYTINYLKKDENGNTLEKEVLFEYTPD